MRIIGLTGMARAGKDTVAGLIADESAGLSVVRQAFADKLKISAALALGYVGPNPIGEMDRLKVKGRVCVQVADDEPWAEQSGRAFLQHYGTEAHRDTFGQDFWLDAVLPEGRNDCDVLVIPDVRFENEAKRVLAHGGEVWRIERPNIGRANGHASEDGLSSVLVTRTLMNEGNLDHLRLVTRLALRRADVIA